MTTALLQPIPHTSPGATLTLSQRAKTYLQSQTAWTLPYPLSLLTASESQEKWAVYENLFLANLRTGDFDTAETLLTQLVQRFGAQNEHVLALNGLYEEATAKDETELAEVLRGYDELLKVDAANFPIRKRRAALLRAMGRTADAIAALRGLLDQSPTDAEAWSELSDLYVKEGMYEQAIYCLEEVLLVMPNAWNMHARLGEVTFLAAIRGQEAEQTRQLSESVRRFCRSLELCEDYLRGFYGLKLSTDRLLQALEAGNGGGGGGKVARRSEADPGTGDSAPPSVEMVKKLNEVATRKLGEIVRRAASGEKGWDGYSEAELKATRELLEESVQKIER
ncbi:tetratricopeptide repeat domain-containing protein [Teratosphaeria nubilosa]|uniref:ER membrane protein complex subunit 2 n=1 Tax=Teratosphaeria nubilosa TaxID=161662 RepID=A0A6G1L187_9PEZI|nr:tetratricopeptide repeat domain-containing protein [Teratosphaeria nubilosa]